MKLLPCIIQSISCFMTNIPLSKRLSVKLCIFKIKYLRDSKQWMSIDKRGSKYTRKLLYKFYDFITSIVIGVYIESKTRKLFNRKRISCKYFMTYFHVCIELISIRHNEVLYCLFIFIDIEKLLVVVL